MASSAVTKLSLVVVLCMVVVGVPHIAHALTCGQVSSNLGSCLNYAKSGGKAVPPACCNGIKTLYGLTKTTADRRAACNCLKQFATTVKGVNPALAEGIPSKCGLKISYKISASTNCATVK